MTLDLWACLAFIGGVIAIAAGVLLYGVRRDRGGRS
jgi:hypothetical protein